MSQSVEPDAVESCAAAAVILAADHLANSPHEDQSIRHFAGNLLNLPSLRSNRNEWLAGLWELITFKHRPLLKELSTRSRSELILLKICFCANQVFRDHRIDASSHVRTSPKASRYRHLMSAAIHVGVLVGSDMSKATDKRELEAEVRRALSRSALDHRHKDNREDRAHVIRWLTEHRNKYKSDEDRADAIIATKQVSAKRSTVRRWITEWNRAEREKRTD